MKRNLITLFCCIISALPLYGQETPVRYNAISLYSEQMFYLNGGLRATVGGQSRVGYKIELPANTVEWYYSVTVERSELKNIGMLNLFSQLTHLIDKTGIGAIATTSILTPTGSGVCNVYLISNNNIGAFKAKQQFNYDVDHSVLNYKSGVVRIKMKPGYFNNFYIGFQNPSSMEGVTVRFSAVAIVEEMLVEDKGIRALPNIPDEGQKIWTKDDKNRIYAGVEKGIKRYCAKNDIEPYTETDRKDIAACFTDLFTKTSKEVFNEMAEYEKERLLDNIISNCPKCTGLPSSIFDKAIER